MKWFYILQANSNAAATVFAVDDDGNYFNY